MTRKLWSFTSFCALLICPGCWSKLPANKAVYTVQGRVTLDDQPVRLGRIMFIPEDENGVEAYGLIKSDGTFEVRTYDPKSYDGAVPGDYKVEIHPHNATADGPAPNGVEPTPIPEKYQKTPSSGLKATITSGENKLEYKLKS